MHMLFPIYIDEIKGRLHVIGTQGFHALCSLSVFNKGLIAFWNFSSYPRTASFRNRWYRYSAQRAFAAVSGELITVR